MLQWLRALRQTTTYLGVVMIVAIWSGIFLLENEERKRANEDGIRQASNLARVFEEYISRVIKGTDSQLLLLRRLYEQNPPDFDFARWTDVTKGLSDLAIQFTITGPDGIIRLSNLGPIQSRVDISGIEAFHIHKSRADELYISGPMLGRISGKPSIQLTRRVSTPDGSFAGTIGASLDVLQLEKFYDSVDVGRNGVISLVGFDGIIRARSGRDPAAQNFIGESVSQTKLFDRDRQPAGSYWGVSKETHQFEGINRLISYRVVEGLPLFAVVGLAEGDVFQQAASTARQYDRAGFLFTAIVLAGIAIGATRQMRLISATEALEETNRRFDAAVENMPHGLCMFDRHQRLVICNKHYGMMYGLTPEQTKPGTSVLAILEARVASGCIANDGPHVLEKHVGEPAHFPSRYFVRNLSDGRFIAVSREWLPGGGWVGIHQDITQQKRAEAQIVYMARHDALTGMANRAVLVEKIGEAFAGLQRDAGAFIVFMLDLDLFKTINDSLGHPVGDELLKAVAGRLLACMRKTDTVARIGGDEFAILAMTRGNPREAAIATANRLLEAISAPYDVDGNKLDIATSIGIALAPEHGSDVDQILKNVDLALYKAKSEGRNTYRLFEAEMESQAYARRLLQNDLRTALMRGDEFELHYQPIVDIATGELTGVEALVRWRHPQRGMIGPDDFIPLAEETGLINPLGEWVLRRACSDAAGWPSGIKVSVNLSPAQFRRADPVSIFAQALAESGLPPERLELEITETVLMQGNTENITTLHQLRRLGMSIVLDDFGTGYSSLSYLRMFPFDRIKIDRCFVAESVIDPDCAAIVAAIARLGRSLGIGTVAEGIETEAQLALVRAAGCTLAQGFLFGRPCRGIRARIRGPAGAQGGRRGSLTTTTDRP
jgi:diguanylate cyclase (GGDEF)-like protein